MEYTKQIKKISKYDIGDIVLISFATPGRHMIGIITDISIDEKEDDFSFVYTIAFKSNELLLIDEDRIEDDINKLSYIDILNNIEKYNIDSNKEIKNHQLFKPKYRKGDIVVFKDICNPINKDISSIPDSIGLIRSIEVREDGYINYYISYINHNKKRLLISAQIDTMFIQEESIDCIANPSLISEYLIDDFSKLINYKEKHDI